jgi:mRNA interferase MazF
LFELALEDFSAAHHATTAATDSASGSRLVNQGDIFWIRPHAHGEAELGYYPHPYVVIQDNLLNHSRIDMLVVCALTSNLKQAKAPGNVLLELGEADLPRQSVIDVAKVSAVHRSQLGECIGALSQRRIQQILAGMRFLQVSFFAR